LDKYKIETSVQGVQAFFKRAGSVRNPMGFEIERPEPEPPQMTPQPQPAENVNAKKEPTGHTYEKWVEAERQKEKEKSSEPFKPYE